MRLLFTLDAKDYDINSKAIIRPSVRGIIIRGDKVGMVHSLGYDYYKFPGGGIVNRENDHGAIDPFMLSMLERDARVLEMLIEEGFFAAK